MNDYASLTNQALLDRLEPPSGKVRMVLDTDTYNEIDDQFAVAYALLSPQHMDVEAIYAAPFLNDRAPSAGDGMEKSYDEILRVLQRLGVKPDGLTFKGSDRFLPGKGKPVQSPAATDLIERAMASQGKPLYVVAIGAPTNVASAILIEPKIIERIVLIWLGGHPHYWPDAKDFNSGQDIPASQVMFDCGAPFVQIPCYHVSELLATTVPELEANLKGKSGIADYLFEIFAAYNENHFGWSKVIWDISTIALLVNPDWIRTEIVHSPVFTDRGTYSHDASRHLMRVATHLNRDHIFRDLFRKLQKA
jgi:inosine-uridine nucleoside N-ribohydrolase